MGTTKGTQNELKKFDFGNLPVEDQRTTKNDEEWWKIFATSLTEMSRKRYGNALAWIFFTETIFLTNFM